MDEMTVKEVAEALGVSTQTIRRRIDKGEYIARKEVNEMGERWLISANQIQTGIKDVPVASLTRQINITELQAVIQETIRAAVSEAVPQAVINENIELKQNIKELKEQLATATDELENQYRLLERRLDQLSEKKTPWWKKIFDMQ